MVEKSLSNVCKGKSPAEICNLRIADIACGSGVYLEEAFQYLQAYCVEWYLTNEPDHLIEIGNGKYKLPLDEKQQILCSCIFGIDIDIHAVEVAKFSLLIKLIENETEPSVRDTTPILPELVVTFFMVTLWLVTKSLRVSVTQQIQLFHWFRMIGTKCRLMALM